MPGCHIRRQYIPEQTRGFTLIELLVVISIIGLLASVVLVALNNTRVRARDTKRIADIKQIYTALHMYYQTNGFLPTTATEGQVDPGGWDYSSQGGFLPFLVTDGELSKAPQDPINNGTGDVFYGGSGYAFAYYCYPNGEISLGVKLENPSNYSGMLGNSIVGSVYWIANHEPGYKCQ